MQRDASTRSHPGRNSTEEVASNHHVDTGLLMLRTIRELLRAGRPGNLREGILGGCRLRRNLAFDRFMTTQLRAVWDEPIPPVELSLAAGLETDVEWMTGVVQSLWNWFVSVTPDSEVTEGQLCPPNEPPPRGPPPPMPVHADRANDEEDSDAVSAMQTTCDAPVEPDRGWGTDALEVRNDIAMVLRNMVQNNEEGEACHAATVLYRHFHKVDETRTGSLQWVEALIRPELDRYILRVTYPHEYELDEDMLEWLEGIKTRIDACAWRKDKGVLTFRNQRKRRREERGTAAPDGPQDGESTTGASGSSSRPPTSEPLEVPDTTSLMAGGRPRRSRSPARRGEGTTGSSARSSGSRRNAAEWRDWTDWEDWGWSTRTTRVTESTRVLTPRACPASSSRPDQAPYRRTRPREMPPVDPAAPTPLSTSEAVDLWRQLLNIAQAPDMGELDRSVQNGGFAVPREAADNAVDTLKDMDAHDFAMMTLGLIELVRRIMAECSQIMAYARNRDNNMVEVAVEEEESSLMQASGSTKLTPAPARAPGKLTILVELQAEFDTLQRRGWLVQPYAAALLDRLNAHRSACGSCEVLDLLSSLIVTVRGDLDEAGEASACSRPVEDWVRTWWRKVEAEIPRTSMSAGSSEPIEVLDTQVEEGEQLALEELEYHRERDAEMAARSAQEAAHDEEESTWESEMERIQAMYAQASSQASSAASYQAWEDWVMDQELRRPAARTRNYVEVDVGPAPGATGVNKKLKVAIPLECGPQVVLWQAQLVQTDAASSSSAPSTVLAPPAESQPMDQQRVSLATSADQGVPRELDFGNYMTQYSRLQQGLISPEYVRQMWGESTLDLMLAQADVEQLEGAEETQLDLHVHGSGFEGSATMQGASNEGPAVDISTAETVIEGPSHDLEEGTNS